MQELALGGELYATYNKKGLFGKDLTLGSCLHHRPSIQLVQLYSEFVLSILQQF